MAVKVIKNEQSPESTEVLAAAILTIAKGFEKLLASDLKEETIVTLIHDMPNSPGKPAIRTVLKNLKTLRGYYLRK